MTRTLEMAIQKSDQMPGFVRIVMECKDELTEMVYSGNQFSAIGLPDPDWTPEQNQEFLLSDTGKSLAEQMAMDHIERCSPCQQNLPTQVVAPKITEQDSR